MAVGFQAVSESHGGTTGSTSGTSFQWTHSPGAASQGVLVYVFNTSAASDITTSVTYGTIKLSKVTGGSANDTANEQANTTAWFYGGGGLTTGNKTVTVVRTNNANELYAVAITVTALSATNVTGVVLQQENQAPAEAAVNDGSPGTNSMRFGGAFYGGSGLPGAGANSTALIDIDFGLRTVQVVRETTAGQGSRNVGFSNATSDDWACVLLAVREGTALTTTSTSTTSTSTSTTSTSTSSSTTTTSTSTTTTSTSTSTTSTSSSTTSSSTTTMAAGTTTSTTTTSTSTTTTSTSTSTTTTSTSTTTTSTSTSTTSTSTSTTSTSTSTTSTSTSTTTTTSTSTSTTSTSTSTTSTSTSTTSTSTSTTSTSTSSTSTSTTSTSTSTTSTSTTSTSTSTTSTSTTSTSTSTSTSTTSTSTSSSSTTTTGPSTTSTTTSSTSSSSSTTTEQPIEINAPRYVRWIRLQDGTRIQVGFP